MSNALVKPPRQPLPLALYALLACLVVAHVILRVRPDVCLLMVLALIAAGLACIAWLKRASFHFAEIIVVSLITALVAAAVSWLAASAATSATQELASSSISSYTLEIAHDMQPSDTAYRCRCVVSCKGRHLGEAYLVCSDQLLLGTTIRCIGRFSAPDESAWGASQKAEGILGSIRAVHIIEQHEPQGLNGVLAKLRQTLLEALQPDQTDGQALIAALSLGWRSDFKDRGLSDLFSTCGMSHVAAVSGTHVAIVCTLVGTLIIHTRMNIKLRILVLVILTGLFVLMTGACASSIRAWIMSLSALGAQLVGRRNHSLSALSLTALAMALIHPTLSGNLGFLLSITCVGGLCLFATYAGYVCACVVGPFRAPFRLPERITKACASALRSFETGLGASAVAALVSLPLTVSAFGKLSLIGPLANTLLAGPLALLIGTSLVCTLLGWTPLLQGPILALTTSLAELILTCLRTLSRIPGACVSLELSSFLALLIVIAAATALYVAWPNVNRKLLLAIFGIVATCALASFLRCRFFAPARICVLDVGQGDAILIQDGPSAILVDSGPDASLVHELTKLNVSHLDAIVITHLHDDHYGGVAELKGELGCDTVYVGRGAAQEIPDALNEAICELTGQAAQEVGYGTQIHVGGFSLEVIWPDEPQPGTENSHSLVMYVSYQHAQSKLCALLTGDAEHDVLESCIRHGLVGDIDLLKVGHHGSEVSLSREDAQVLLPELAIASAGQDNSYGHPTQTCISTLEDAGALFLCTKDVGTIVVEPGNDCMHVHERASPHEVE